MNSKSLYIALTTLLALGAIQATAKSADANDPSDSWQQNALFNPGSYTEWRDSKGLVSIYDGMTDTEVSHFMDDQFGRIQNVMFTRVKITDASGAVQKDVDGEDLVMDDDCD